MEHYNTLVEDMFNGDSTKVVAGFCISGCSSYNTNGNDAARVMIDLAKEHPCNGGAFFWAADDDTNGAWSAAVSSVTQPSSGCSQNPTSYPKSPPRIVTTMPPTFYPKNPPLTVPANPPTNITPTKAPPESPVQLPGVFPPTSCATIVDNSGQTGGCGPASPCADSSKCCSKFGWCGTGADYCDFSQCCQNNCWGDAPGPTPPPVGGPAPTPSPTVRPDPTPAPVPAPTLPVMYQPTSCPNRDNSGQWGGCGPGSPCADSSRCCSQWGWCGTGADYCDLAKCCQNNCWDDALGPISAPIDGPAPTLAPTVRPAPTPAPVPTPTLPVVSQPTSCPNTDNSGQTGGCGPGSPCADSSKCCSQ